VPNSAFALQQALVAASRDTRQRAEALKALTEAELWAITWPAEAERPRTLTSSTGVVALPMFTSEAQLLAAAERLGWLSPEGQVAHRRLPLTEAMRSIHSTHAALVVVDLGSDHALELDAGEMAMVAANTTTIERPAKRGSSPQRGSAPASERGSAPTPEGHRPSARGDFQEEAPTGQLARTPSSRTPSVGTYGPFPGETTNARVNPLKTRSSPPDRLASERPPSVATRSSIPAFAPAPTTSSMRVLDAPPEDALLDDLVQVLKDYPEVEWASMVGGEPSPSVALRLAADFRVNLPEISRRLRHCAIVHARPFEVVVLDTPEQTKEARQVGVPFYPWRKK
jgi:hypothetical protein